MLRKLLEQVSEENFRNLPPPCRKRLRRILTDHARAILYQRPSVVRERRGAGRAYWRLYLETGSGKGRKRRRVYVGSQGGPELRKAIRELRRAYWMGYDGPGGLLKKALKEMAQEGREARKTARGAREAVLGQTYRHLHGRRVRRRRDVSAEQRYRAEYRHLSYKALEKATWPGITEEEYVTLRKAEGRLTDLRRFPD